MNEKLKKILFSSIVMILRPLVRILLRNGIAFRVFADLAKFVYVDVAMKEFKINGKKQSISRVSVLTGLSRKEVSRIKKMDNPEDITANERYQRAARVISGWIRDPQYCDASGEPLPLNPEGDSPNFAALVKRYSGDIPPRSLLDELLNVEAVEKSSDNKISLVTRGYVPAKGEEDKIAILGQDVSRLISTIHHNIALEEGGVPFFQRKVMYDNLPAESIDALRAVINDHSQELLEKLDKLISEKDRDANPQSNGTGRKELMLGIYFNESDFDKES